VSVVSINLLWVGVVSGTADHEFAHAYSVLNLVCPDEREARAGTVMVADAVW